MVEGGFSAALRVERLWGAICVKIHFCKAFNVYNRHLLAYEELVIIILLITLVSTISHNFGPKRYAFLDVFLKNEAENRKR